MSDLKTAAQQALEAIDYLDAHPEGGIDEAETAIEALRAALAQPEPAAPTPLNENEADPYVLWAEIARLRAAVAGPKGFATWQDAATDERVRRVRAEQELRATLAQPDELLSMSMFATRADYDAAVVAQPEPAAPSPQEPK